MQHLSAYWSPAILTANVIIILHLLGAVGIGCLLGFERSFHGRAAGLRTYAVVCCAACLLTVLCGFPNAWFGGQSATLATMDPTRVIQGIVTGIGFLGAGVIMKEGFTIRGLSTAASIWMTAAIGVAIGAGFFLAAIVGALLILVVMASFRRLEAALPHQRILHLSLVYARQHAVPAQALNAFVARHGFVVTDLACQLGDGGERFEYHLVLQSTGSSGFSSLVDSLTNSADVLEFHLAPSRD